MTVTTQSPRVPHSEPMFPARPLGSPRTPVEHADETTAPRPHPATALDAQPRHRGTADTEPARGSVWWEWLVTAIDVIAAAWLIASPWIGDFATGRVGWTSWVVGGGIAVSAAAMQAPVAAWRRAGCIALLMLAVCLYVSPWLLGYTSISVAANNAWFVGSAVGEVAIVYLLLTRPRSLRRARIRVQRRSAGTTDQ